MRASGPVGHDPEPEVRATVGHGPLHEVGIRSVVLDQENRVGVCGAILPPPRVSF